MKYEEALRKIEHFMNKTGIRHYCTQICKGDCCRSIVCKGFPECKTNRKIACSIFICRDLISLIFNDSEKDIYYRVREHILLSVFQEIGRFTSCYTSKYTKSMKENMVFEDNIINLIKKFDVDKIKRKMIALYELSFRVKRNIEERYNEGN